MADEWSLQRLEELATTCTLDDLESAIEQILAGKIVGRTVVEL